MTPTHEKEQRVYKVGDKVTIQEDHNGSFDAEIIGFGIYSNYPNGFTPVAGEAEAAVMVVRPESADLQRYFGTRRVDVGKAHWDATVALRA